MSKRFTDTEKWNDPWHRSLPPHLKCFWDYLTAKCNTAGVWKVDLEQAEFFIGEKINPEEALRVFGKRVERISNDYWFVAGFIEFQYDNFLSDECRPHRPVIAALKKSGLWERVSKGFRKGTDTPKDKDKDTDWVFSPEVFEKFYAAYPKKRSKGDAEKAWRAIRPSDELSERIILALNRAKNSDDWLKEGGKYIPYPASWLRAMGWEDVHEPMVERRGQKSVADLLAEQAR